MITLITGPMCSGKSTLLLSKLERAVIARRKVCFISPELDVRNYLTHSGKKISKGVDSYKFKCCNDALIGKENLYDSIFIDEGQFFDDLDIFCKKYGANRNIYIACLNATSEQKMFEPIIKAFPYCDNIIKLNAICTKCGSELGNYTHYIGKNKKDGDVLVGDSDYEALCQDCLEKESQVI